MTHDRVFCNIPIDKEIILRDDQAFHLIHVRRVKKGGIVTLFSGDGREYMGRVIEVRDNALLIEIFRSFEMDREPGISITLGQAILKPAVMDKIIPKIVELGADGFIPLVSERVDKRLVNAAGKRLERWRKIAVESCKQCKRNKIPHILDVIAIQDIFKPKGFDLCLIACIGQYSNPIKKALKEISCKPKNILYIIGPEGGFSQGEVDTAINSGFKPVSLTPSILRSQTAGEALLSMLIYEFGIEA